MPRQTDSGEWLIDTIKVTDEENNVGDQWSGGQACTTCTKASGSAWAGKTILHETNVLNGQHGSYWWW